MRIGSRNLVAAVVAMAIACIVFMLPLGCDKSLEPPPDVPDYYNELEPYWHPIGAGANYNGEEHSFQCIVSGDLTGTGELTALTNYHHGLVGMFLHTKENDQWEKQVLAPIFTPGRMKDGWPAKGLVGGDIDNDGYKEVITCADVVSFPAEVGGKRRPFPVVVYIDLNDSGNIVDPRPLLWWKWGERLASPDFAGIVPTILPPSFRVPDNLLPDIMVPTCTQIDGKQASRIFILQQPPEGFGSCDYTYVAPGTIGTYPYETEAFYVRHLYIRAESSTGMSREMTFSPGRFPGAKSAVIMGVATLDFDVDGLMDIVVSVFYYSGTDEIGSDIIFYRRLPSLDKQYTFTEVQRIETEGFGLKSITAVDLDGDPSNGRESLVAGVGPSGTSMPVSTLAYLMPAPGGYELLMADFPEGNPYLGIYSNFVVLDGNRDGYDDIIVYCFRKGCPKGTMYGDLVYFENTGKALSSSRFIYSPEHAKVLMSKQSPSWQLCLQQADDDEELEFTTVLMNKLPYWTQSMEGEARAYYCDIFDVLANSSR